VACVNDEGEGVESSQQRPVHKGDMIVHGHELNPTGTGTRSSQWYGML
jgi:hypothetical protein